MSPTGAVERVYIEALARLSDRLHYLNASGDRLDDTTRYWFDVRANLRREMEARKDRFDDAEVVQPKLAEFVTKLTAGRVLFEGVHVFTEHGDVPDDGALRLVVLPVRHRYSRQEAQQVFDAALAYVRSHGTKPRFRGNRLVFLAADASTLARVRESVRIVLAWASIVTDIQKNRLVIDTAQQQQAAKELAGAEAQAQRAVRECFRWVVAPSMLSVTDRDVTFEPFSLNTAGSAFGAELERVCTDNEVVVKVWSPIHLRDRLRELYWKDGRTTARALAVWEDAQKFLYLPRLESRAVFEATVRQGAVGRDFFATALGEPEGQFEGFRYGDGAVQVDTTLLLIEPGAAAAWEAEQAQIAAARVKPAVTEDDKTPVVVRKSDGGAGTRGNTGEAPGAARVKSFVGSVDVSAASARMKLVELAEEIIAVLASDPHAEVKVTVEINGEFPRGVPDHVKRAVSETTHSSASRSKWS